MPVAITTGLLLALFLFTALHIHTTFAPSPVPPNHAAIMLPLDSSPIEEAWHSLKEGLLTTNSVCTNCH